MIDTPIYPWQQQDWQQLQQQLRAAVRCAVQHVREGGLHAWECLPRDAQRKTEAYQEGGAWAELQRQGWGRRRV